jgi:biotin-(acetyl-CoA carboxylase) ligase
MLEDYSNVTKSIGHSGRIGNEWLCAEGAAMFNVNLNVPYQTVLGQSIVLLQHLMAVSICQSIAQLAPVFLQFY